MKTSTTPSVKTILSEETVPRVGTLGLLVAGLVFAAASVAAQPDKSTEFSNPQRITISGYNGDLMEPFVSRDGKYLFFNNSNAPQANTELHWAERVDDLTFQYKGPIQDVNTAALEAVPSMDSRGTFYFVSNRSYKQTASTIYRAYFADGVLSGVELAPGVSTATLGIVNFDAEISADGETLYFVESQFSFFGRPKTARIMLARKRGNGFVRDPGGVLILRMVNTLELNYAPATSASELELFFTRLNQDGPAIYVAHRVSRDAPFAPAQKIASITGFVEGPTISGDGRSLYYHKKENGKFVLYKVTRQEPWTPASENRKP